MATNRVYEEGNQLALTVSAVNGSGTGNLVKSGDPGALGILPFVALVDEDADGKATCAMVGVFNLAVVGEDADGNAAIAEGDAIYWDNTGGKLNADATGVYFGVALEDVGSGATTTIMVRLSGAPAGPQGIQGEPGA